MFSRRAKQLITVVFLSMLWMPLLVMIYSERLDVSIAERRELATFPLITPDSGMLTRFPVQFETWFNENIIYFRF